MVLTRVLASPAREIRLFTWLLVLLGGGLLSGRGQITNGTISIGSEQLAPGTSLSLDGEWSYTPGYLVSGEAHPERETSPSNTFNVAVPQLLNRVYWWLDDSEDFKRFEDARLKKLGFDTEQTQDGWYQLLLNCPALPKDRH